MTPQENKNIKIGVGIGAAILIIYLLTKNGKDASGSAIDPTGNGTVTNPGYQSFNPKTVKSILFEAMNSYAGTDEEAIISALKTVTPAQFKLVVTAFGLEKYTDWLGYKTDFGTPRDLKYWLKAEVSSSEYNNLRNKYPQSL